MLLLKECNVPDWVYLRYAYAQMHSDTVQRLIKEPEFLFKRLDHINENDKTVVSQRNAIFQEFLEICAEYCQTTKLKIDTDKIYNKTVKYGLLETESWKVFIQVFPDKFKDFLDQTENKNPLNEVESGNVVIRQEHLKKESRERIFEFFSNVFCNNREKLLDGKIIQSLASDLLAQYPKEKNIIRVAAIEGAVSIMAASIEKSEINQKMAFSNASKILIDKCGLGEAVAIDVVIEMAKAMQYIVSLDNAIDNDDEIVNDFTENLLEELEKENDKLGAKINELQDEIRELLKENQDYKQLLEEKKEYIKQISENEKYIDNIAKSVSNGITKGHDLLDGNKKILVIGQSVTSRDNLLGIVKIYGYEKKDFVFWDDYDKIKTYAERMSGGSFTSIIAGPMPHKVSGVGDYSSLIEKMKQPGYPYMEEARNEGGELKITKTSFKKALEKVTKHLLAIQ